MSKESKLEVKGWGAKSDYISGIYPSLNGKVSISAEAINPDRDIVPTDRCEIVESNIDGGGIMWIYNRRGNFQGCIRKGSYEDMTQEGPVKGTTRERTMPISCIG